MGVISEAVKYLLDAGVTRDVLLQAISDMERVYDLKKTPSAIRQQRYRDKIAPESVTKRHETSQSVTSVTVTPDGDKGFPSLNGVSLLSPHTPHITLPLKPTPSKTLSAREDFEIFWEAFPRQRRGGKENAYRAYTNALSKTTKEEIHAGLQAYIHSDEVVRKFAKGAAAWLNDERWASDYTAIPISGSTEPAKRGNVEKHLTALHRAGNRNVDGQPVQPSANGGDILEGQIISEPAGGGAPEVVIPAFLLRPGTNQTGAGAPSAAFFATKHG